MGKHLLPIVLASCAVEPDARPPDAAPEPRLRAMYVAFESRFLVGVFDTKHEQPCDPRPTVDGHRCVLSGDPTSADVAPIDEALSEPLGWAPERFMTSHWRAEGRLLLPAALHDTVLDVRCHLVWNDDGSGLCVPPHITSSIGFTDDRCTQPVAMTFVSWPNAFALLGDGSALARYQVRRIGSETAAPARTYLGHTFGSTSYCNAHEPGMPTRYYELEPFEKDFLEVEHATTGTGRIVQMRHGKGGVTIAGTLVDTVLETSCTPEVAANGDVICIPHGTGDRFVPAPGSVYDAFRDATCETPVQLIVLPSAPGDPPPRVAVDEDRIVYELGAPYAGRAYTDKLGGCDEIVDRDLRRLGREIPRSELAHGTLVLGP